MNGASLLPAGPSILISVVLRVKFTVRGMKNWGCCRLAPSHHLPGHWLENVGLDFVSFVFLTSDTHG